MEIVAEPGWSRLAESVRGKTALFLGETDTGKSTLVRFLVERLVLGRRKVFLVDADIGQSALGLPGTISMRSFASRDDLGDYSPQRMYFVGTFNPAMNIPRMVRGTKTMVDAARTQGAGTILIDTTGLVGGSLGRALKLAKITAVEAEVVVAVQCERELEHILAPIEEAGYVRIHRIRPSRRAKKKSWATRARYRWERLKDYFEDSREVDLDVKDVQFYADAKRIDIVEAGIEPGTLVALNRYRKTLGLGVLSGVTGGFAVVETPLRSPGRINRVLIGQISMGEAA